MFYFLFVLLFVVVFLVAANRGSRHTAPLVYLLVSYLVLLCGVMMYLAKDTYYLNIVTRYFSMPKVVWNSIIFLRLSKSWLLRIMNLSGMGVVLGSVLFALSFGEQGKGKLRRGIALGAGAYCGLVCAVFDPAVQVWGYNRLYPDYSRILLVGDRITCAVQVCNFALMAGAILFLLYAYRKLPGIRLIKRNSLTILVCYLALISTYLFLFRGIPAFLVKVSRFAGTVNYRSLPLRHSAKAYLGFPYYLLAAVLLIAYSVYQLSAIRRKIEEESFTLIKQIDAASTTSKAFCHYVKNEVLSIQTLVELLPLENREEEICAISSRCDALYTRLDQLHRSTKTSQLRMEEQGLGGIMDAVLGSFQGELAGYTVVRDYPETDLRVLADTEYFNQAIHNIVRNALDAMQAQPPERRRLICQVRAADNWALLLIKDRGVGIAEQNLGRIFQPFFSSRPSSKSWGVGLSLTYKIVAAHEGRIEVESECGVGTTMTIMLPGVRSF